MLWITWRQHRTALIGTLAVTVGVSTLLLWMWQAVAELNYACSQHDCITGVPGALGDQLRWVYASLYFGQPILAGLVAMFWGAPLLAREFEQRTHLVAWAQDVTPMRWFGSKVALLGAAVLVLSAVLATASWQLVGAMKDSGHYFGMDDFKALEQWPPTQVLYTLFGFALGLAVGLLVRRTVLAMGTTLIVFAVVRLVVAFTVLWWVPPLQVTASPQSDVLPPGAYELSGYAMPYLKSVVFRYQPVERLATFRWLEVITYAVLTLLLAGVAWAGVRRATRVG
jgi:hypothetical protein